MNAFSDADLPDGDASSDDALVMLCDAITATVHQIAKAVADYSVLIGEMPPSAARELNRAQLLVLFTRAAQVAVTGAAVLREACNSPPDDPAAAFEAYNAAGESFVAALLESKELRRL